MKKKILIFSSRGGGGHTSAARAITNYLNTFTTEIVDLGDLLSCIDPFYWLSFKRMTGQDLYNILLRQNRKKTVNGLYSLGRILTRALKYPIRAVLMRYIKKTNPDMVISVIPMINGALADVCNELDIPYLLVPTDLELHAFMNDVRKETKPFTLALGFDLPEIRYQLAKRGIAQENIKVIGFPIRHNFFEPKNHVDICTRLAIPSDKPIIMLIMGATGSSATITYLNLLKTITQPFHLIICVGRSKHLIKEIDAIAFPDHISYSAVDISEDISNIMSIADLCITKPGTVTFAETLYMNLPVFLDNTCGSLLWEDFNIRFLSEYNLGSVIKEYDDITQLVTKFLNNQSWQAIIKANIEALHKKEFGQELHALIKEMMPI